MTDSSRLTSALPSDGGFGVRGKSVPGMVFGGLTVIANAPNPVGQALVGRFFDGAIAPLGLFTGALVPTPIAAFVFRVL